MFQWLQKSSFISKIVYFYLSLFGQRRMGKEVGDSGELVVTNLASVATTGTHIGVHDLTHGLDRRRLLGSHLRRSSLRRWDKWWREGDGCDGVGEGDLRQT